MGKTDINGQGLEIISIIPREPGEPDWGKGVNVWANIIQAPL